MSLRSRVRPGAVLFSGLAVLLLALPAYAAAPTGESPSANLQASTTGLAVQADSTSPTVRLAGVGYYGNRGRYYSGYRGLYGANSFYRYGNPYLYRGSSIGYGYTSLYRPSYYPYAYSPYAYRGLSYYQPYSSYYYQRPYAYTSPLSLYGVYYSPAYYYRPAVPVSYGGCYYW